MFSVRYELKAEALLSLVHPALSQVPDTRPVATIIKPSIVRVFDCSNPSDSSQKEAKLRSHNDKTAFKTLNKFRRSAHSSQLLRDITSRSAVASCGIPHFPEWLMGSLVTQNELTFNV